MSEYILEMKDICKSFPGVKALDHVQLSLKPGHVHALMGENGAGKSTLMKCLFGIYKKAAKPESLCRYCSLYIRSAYRVDSGNSKIQYTQARIVSPSGKGVLAVYR